MGDHIWLLVNGIHAITILVATAWSRGLPIVWLRMMIAFFSLLGWHWVGQKYVLVDVLVGTWWSGCAELMVVMLFVFRGRTWREYVVDVGVAYLYAILLAMLWQLLAVMTGQAVYAVQEMWMIDMNDQYAVLWVVLISIFMIMFGFWYLIRRKKMSIANLEKTFCYSCEIHWQGRSWQGRAWVDSGNQLIEPHSGLPVAIISKKNAEMAWPKLQNIPFAQEKVETLYDKLPDFFEQMNYAFRVIPFHTLQCGESALLAFKPDLMRINDRTYHGIWVGLTDQIIQNPFRAEVLLPPID